jgi:CRISPR-associated endoribonuclease Cas6
MKVHGHPHVESAPETLMRVKLTLAALRQRAALPLNYQHAVASLIYAVLGQASAEFATRLHDEGFNDGGRSFKLFTFSRLDARSARIAGETLLLEDPAVSFQISSPVADFIEHFVEGLFRAETFRIADAAFRLEGVETLAPPDFTSRMRMRALSPVTETTSVEGSKHARFLDLSDEWSEIVSRNLARKFRALHGREPADAILRWTWDRAYVADAGRKGRRLSKLTDIRGIKVRGWLAPFHVEGSRELIEIGYEAGYGSRNSMGFGMAEASER